MFFRFTNLPRRTVRDGSLRDFEKFHVAGDIATMDRRWIPDEFQDWLLPMETGWWVFSHPSEKYEFVNWDDDYSQQKWENRIHGNQTTNQQIFWNPDANHGAGIFTYKTGWFWGFLYVSMGGKYSSTMEHMKTVIAPIFDQSLEVDFMMAAQRFELSCIYIHGFSVK